MTAHFVDSVLNKASTTKVLQFHIGNTGYRIDYSGRGNIFLCVWWKVDFLKITLSQFSTLCADVETRIRTVVFFAELSTDHVVTAPSLPKLLTYPSDLPDGTGF